MCTQKTGFYILSCILSVLCNLFKAVLDQMAINPEVILLYMTIVVIVVKVILIGSADWSR